MPHSATASSYCTLPEQVEETVRGDVRRRHLLRGVTRLGLAVSGGADSVALFHVLLPLCREAGVEATVLHLNHGLRPEAGEDAQFVADLARDACVPFVSERANLSSDARDGESLEMAARGARLAFFARCSREAGLDAIATGHHADDVAETLLLRLARGSGATGLSGLRPASRLSESLALIRPLLSVSDSALRGWLKGRALPWREDASNLDRSIPRNFVRTVLLPQLEQTWTPDLRARLCQSAEALREDDQLLDALARRALESAAHQDTLAVAELLKHPEALQRRALRLWLFQRGLAEASGLASVRSLLERCTNSGDWRLQLAGGRFAVCRSGLLSLPPTEDAPTLPEVVVPVPGTFRWDALRITTERCAGIRTCANGMGRYPAECSLDAAALNGRELRVRPRRPGDRIAPLGLAGSKKVQDLFVDAKIPEHARDAVPIFVCGADVVWVPGYRVARAFAVPTPEAPSVRIAVNAAE